MVKFGSHLLFLQGKVPLFLVEYKKVQAVGTGEGREAFAAAWRESLARASTAKEEAMAALWAQVFSGCATTEDVDAKRGLRPIIALRMYHGSVSESEARTLVEAFDKVRMACIANWEALRKLVKKFDKRAQAEPLSNVLLPLLYASSITSLVTDDPFETLKALVVGKHPETATSGDQSRLGLLAEADALHGEAKAALIGVDALALAHSPTEERQEGVGGEGRALMPVHGEGLAQGVQGEGGNVTATIRLTGHLYNRHLLERALDIIESQGGVTQSVGEPIMGGSRRRASVITMRVDNVRSKGEMEAIIEQIQTVFNEDRAARMQETTDMLGGRERRTQSGNSLAMEEDQDNPHGIEVLVLPHEAGAAHDPRLFDIGLAEDAMMAKRRAEELAWLRSLVHTAIPPADLVRLVAHRGFHSTFDRTDLRPIENSIEAYELAWTSGMKLCECDVAVSRDGKLVLGHDADYSRLALQVPGEEEKRALHVGQLTLAELMAMPLKSGSRPPTLLEVLTSASNIGNGVQLVIEIKPGNITAADALISLFKSSPDLVPCIAVVMSFDAFIMNSFAVKLAALRGGKAGRRPPARSDDEYAHLSRGAGSSQRKREAARRGGGACRRGSGAVDVGGDGEPAAKMQDSVQSTTMSMSVLPSSTTGAHGAKVSSAPIPIPAAATEHEGGVRGWDGEWGMKISPPRACVELGPGSGEKWWGNRGWGFIARSTSPDMDERWLSYGRSHFPKMAQKEDALSELAAIKEARGPASLRQARMPKLLLLTVADEAVASEEGKCLLDINKDTTDVEKAAAKLDGVYVEFQKEMLEAAGSAAIKALSQRRLVGVWMHAHKHPDSLQTAQHLMHSCGVSFVNTDLPNTFVPTHTRHKRTQKKHASFHNVLDYIGQKSMQSHKKSASMDNVLEVLNNPALQTSAQSDSSPSASAKVGINCESCDGRQGEGSADASGGDIAAQITEN